MRRHGWRILLIVATLTAATVAVGAGQGIAQMLRGDDSADIGPEPGPSSVGAPTDPVGLPAEAGQTATETPAPDQTVPRMYPDPEAFEDEKARANAQATLTATHEGESP